MHSITSSRSFPGWGLPYQTESRPSRRGLGDYYFYIDLEGHISDRPVEAALDGIEKKAAMVKVLGSYPRA